MADPVISAKLIVLYRFMSHNFPRSKTMWFLANSSIWHTKMLLNLTIPHPTTSLNVFLWQFPSFSSCLEQRTVRNTRGPFLVLFSFMKEQVFVPKTPNIFAIIPDHLNSTVCWRVNCDFAKCYGLPSVLRSWEAKCFFWVKCSLKQSVHQPLYWLQNQMIC